MRAFPDSEVTETTAAATSDGARDAAGSARGAEASPRDAESSPRGAEALSRVAPLVAGQEPEALEFLAARPVHTVYMAGFIRDNGLTSPLNRGTFYGVRDSASRLEGMALVGHVTQVEVRTDAARRALARAAQGCSAAHVIMGERESIQSFWRYYAGAGQPMRLACRELLYAQTWPVEACAAVPHLRRARAEDLPLLMPVQAAMAAEECGVNPLEVDPRGFRERCARRVERGRVWVAEAAGRLDFKADVMAETPEAAYLEGVYVRPAERGTGLGRRCVLRLARELLTRTRALCLLVNERNLEAQSFYLKTGFKPHARYDTIYLHKSNA